MKRILCHLIWLRNGWLRWRAHRAAIKYARAYVSYIEAERRYSDALLPPVEKRRCVRVEGVE